MHRNILDKLRTSVDVIYLGELMCCYLLEKQSVLFLQPRDAVVKFLKIYGIALVVRNLIPTSSGVSETQLNQRIR